MGFGIFCILGAYVHTLIHSFIPLTSINTANSTLKIGKITRSSSAKLNPEKQE